MREIDIERLAVELQGGACVVDVREPDEYAEGHVPGALTAAGLDATNVAGGTSAWVRSGRPTEK